MIADFTHISSKPQANSRNSTSMYKGLSMEDRNRAVTAIVVMIFGRKVCRGRRMK